MSTMEHGLYSTYVNHKCRCEPCRVARAEYQRNYRQANPAYRERSNKHIRDKTRERRAPLDKVKSRPCTDCGVAYPPYVMDFDHVRGEKLFNISQAFVQNRPWEEIAAELDKCDLVCANCHRLRTWTRFPS